MQQETTQTFDWNEYRGGIIVGGDVPAEPARKRKSKQDWKEVYQRQKAKANQEKCSTN